MPKVKPKKKAPLVGGLKTLNNDVAEFKDGTKLYDDNLVEKYYKAVYDSLNGRKSDRNENSLFPFIDKSLKGMMSPERGDLGVRSLDKLTNLVKETTEYFSSSNGNEADFIEYKIAKTLFPWQKPIILMDSKKNTLLCGRRSGKSYVEADLAVMHCAKGSDVVNGYKKKRSVLILGLTTGRTKDVFWENIKKAIELSGLKAHINESELSVQFENGAEIYLKGNNSKVDREKLRGADYSLIIIDEAQSQQALGYLMTDILGPIIKGRDSWVYISGTGAITNRGYWKDITDGSLAAEWRHFTATMKDNPTVPETALDDVLKENHWTKDDITFRREYLAENITDLTRIVYPEQKYWNKVPVINRIAIGVDYGFNDYNALVPLGLGQDNKIYELEGTIKFHKSDVTNIVNNIKELVGRLTEKYKVPESQVICIADNSDQSISAEVQRNKVRIQNAYKTDRIMQVCNLREALRRGDVLLNKDSTLLKEDMDCAVWKFDEENKQVVFDVDDDFFHSDLLPALRYSWQYLNNFINPDTKEKHYNEYNIVKS